MSRVGVLLMAHGTPSSMDEMPEYLRLVRGGRPPSDELVAEMRHNYEAIGGRSPLTDITWRRRPRCGRGSAPKCPWRSACATGSPFIKDALAELAAGGVTRDHRHSDGAAVFIAERAEVHRRRDRARCRPASRSRRSRRYYAHPLLLDAFAERVRAAHPAAGRAGVFTAHSLPQRVIDAGDPYADEVAATARGVAERAGIATYELAYQSAGRTPEPWIGPTLDQLIDDRSVERSEISRGAGRFRLRPHRNPVRHRRPGRRGRPSVLDNAAADASR